MYAILALLLLPFGAYCQDVKDTLVEKCGIDPCEGVPSTGSTDSLCNNKFLGPSVLTAANDDEWSSLFEGYSPLGTYCPKAFLDKFAPSGNKYIYPEMDGALLDTEGKPVTTTYTLPEGMELDRFGSKYGGYLAPRDTPFSWRSIPPSNLNKYPDSPQYNYWVWVVKESFNITGGPIAPWFGQNGYGLQFHQESGLKQLEGRYLELVAKKKCVV
ncbi:hypothetical protein EYZ11_011316 [Aspergillus tanneri]|uniref:TNT domain-containing protein n=1 Tax=Aspergillus tanneri TaxID=1220188 RepID=A0A4S3J598_9EURO|nr:uncharacterized protein ATNIH1004_003724 [Aspergillus tanneri]KAA8651031.1 hypothetical protein ATNIH1004_003724 [Aspergillus tanneri]THC89238.1 hypothetical protein EYZ11_011316 [Aspergillus tanneri]